MSRKGWKKFFKGASWMFPFYRLVDDGIEKKQDHDRAKDQAEKMQAAIENALENAYDGTGDLATLRDDDPDTYALIGTLLLQINNVKWWPASRFEGPYIGGSTEQFQIHFGNGHRLFVTRSMTDGDDKGVNLYEYSLVLVDTTKDKDTIRNHQVKAWHNVALPISDALLIEVVKTALEEEQDSQDSE